MDTQAKLTLRLDKQLIEKAKSRSKESGKSLSKMIADYFAMLDVKSSKPSLPEIPPITRSLLGVLRGRTIDEADYYRHLEEKYL